MQYSYIFGPVPSRRLGISLGLDITPAKNCTFNCVYCECGKTEDLTLERKEYAPTGDVIAELRRYLSGSPHLDSITFSGSGEPTLHSGLGRIIEFLKDEYPQYRVTVLTNSSLLSDSSVRADLQRADLVVPSLDAVSEEAFRIINRPKSSLTSAGLIDGLREFTRTFPGTIWLEIFVVPGVNNTPEEAALFRQVLSTLRFDKVQLNTLDRPGVVDWLVPAVYEAMEEFADSLDIEVEIVARKQPRHSMPAPILNIEDRILATIRVRPCTVEDLTSALGIHEDEVVSCLDDMIQSGAAELHRVEHSIFYRAK